jgi:hypothetical protein
MAYSLPLVPDPPRRFLQNDGTVWERTGSCNRCGSCCKGDPFEGTLGIPEVEGMCFYFRWEAPGIGACLGRDSDYYKNACVHWPGNRLNDEHPNCSYVFSPVD